MALPHAQPLDVIDVGRPGEPLVETRSTSLIKTGRLQLLHFVLAAHEDQAMHHVDDECVLQCLTGDVEVVTPGGTRRLGPGQLVLLPAGQMHGLRARALASAVLATLLLHGGDAGDAGGTGARTLQAEGSGSPRSS